MPPNRPAKPQVKLPKAIKGRVMTGIADHGMIRSVHFKPHPSYAFSWESTVPVLVLPFRSPAQAKRALKFWGMTEEERVEVMAKKMYEDVEGGHAYGWAHEVMTEEVKEGWRESARVILSLITGGQKP